MAPQFPPGFGPPRPPMPQPPPEAPGGGLEQFLRFLQAPVSLMPTAPVSGTGVGTPQERQAGLAAMLTGPHGLMPMAALGQQAQQQVATGLGELEAPAQPYQAPLGGLGGAIAPPVPMGTMTLGAGGQTTQTRYPAQPLPGYMAERAGLRGEREELLREQAAQQTLLGEQRARIRGETEQELAQERERFEAQIGEQQERRQALELEWEQARTQAAQEKVDPDHWWSTRTTGQKVALGLSMMLSGFLHGWTDGRIKNVTKSMIDKAIERDLQTQAANIAKRAGERRELAGIIGNIDRRIGNLQRSQANARIMLTQDMTRRLQGVQDQMADPLMKAKLNAAIVGLREKELEDKNRMFMAAQPTRVVTKRETWRKVPKAAMAQMQRQMSPEAAIIAKKVLPKFNEAYDSMDNISGQIDSAIAEIKKHGWNRISRWVGPASAAEKRIITTYLNPLSASLRKGTGETGVMTDRDYNRYAGRFGVEEDLTINKLTMSGPELIRRLEETKRAMQRTIGTRMMRYHQMGMPMTTWMRDMYRRAPALFGRQQQPQTRQQQQMGFTERQMGF